MTTRSYKTPEAFKTALEQRLKNRPGGAPAINKERQLLVFDRFLARLVSIFPDQFILKGGLALELRIERARTTKDIDLWVEGSPGDVMTLLQRAGKLNLGDFLSFQVEVDAQNPELTGDGIIYEGFRFWVTCKMAGVPYGQRFGVDVAYGDPLVGQPERINLENKLAFAGIAAPSVCLYPAASHIAEKLHAYTMPRPRPNSRVKDLPDIALLAMTCSFESELLVQAIHATFDARATHDVPASLPPPSAFWEEPYAAIAKKDGLVWGLLTAVSAAAQNFVDPILQGKTGIWSPEDWRWR